MDKTKNSTKTTTSDGWDATKIDAKFFISIPLLLCLLRQIISNTKEKTTILGAHKIWRNASLQNIMEVLFQLKKTFGLSITLGLINTEEIIKIGDKKREEYNEMFNGEILDQSIFCGGKTGSRGPAAIELGPWEKKKG